MSKCFIIVNYPTEFCHHRAECIGNELVIADDNKPYMCRRIQWHVLWEYREGSDTTIGTDWISSVGLIKREISMIFPDLKRKIFHTQKYTGASHFAFDSLGKTVPFPLVDSVYNTILREWSIDSLISWLVKFKKDEMLYISPSKKADYRSWHIPQMEVSDTAVGDGHFSKVAILFCDLEMYYHSINKNYWHLIQEYIDSLQTNPVSPVLTDYPCPHDLVGMLLYSPQFAQGWSDCDWDYKANGPWNPKDSLAPFGRSEIARQLRERLEGYYLKDTYCPQ